MAFIGVACGNLGKPDPNSISRKAGADKAPTEEETVQQVSDVSSDRVDEETFQELEVVPDGFSPEEDTESFVLAVMENMTLEEKVGQMFFVRPDALETGFENSVVNDDTIGGVTYVDEMMTAALEDHPVGGIALFEKNIIDEDQLKKLTAELQEVSKLPLFIGVEELGGGRAPIANNVNFDVPLFGSMNTIETSEAAEELGSAVGEYLVGFGVNVELAPLADISPDSEEVLEYSFSADPAAAAALVKAETEGLRRGGVMTAVKHFPGYSAGDAEGEEIPRRESSWEDILDKDALPYLEVLDSTDMLMVGHIELPEVTADGMPASMSRDLIKGRIRDELGYDGIVITDSMAANSVRKNFFGRESAVNAIKAGADMILTPYDLAESFESVTAAVEKGEISRARIDESVKRILTLKAEYGLFGG